MILTGLEITTQVKNGKIVIDPFILSQLNPNSYNYRIGDFYQCLDDTAINKIPESGLLLSPNKLYLCSTFETIGSEKYIVSLIGRSSVGRLGLFVQCHSDMSNLGSAHKWTLELSCIQHIKIYPRMLIGQVSFWEVNGVVSELYKDGYTSHDLPYKSKLI